MTKYQQIEKRKKETNRILKKCPIRIHYDKCGFDSPIVNQSGQCSGCYNPDDKELEEDCKNCCRNEYFIEAAERALEYAT